MYIVRSSLSFTQVINQGFIHLFHYGVAGNPKKLYLWGVATKLEEPLKLLSNSCGMRSGVKERG